MDTTNLIKASATIVTITKLGEGDVYKRIDDSGYSTPELKFGVVQSTMHNGEDAAITALEYGTDYSGSMTVKQKVFTAGKAAALFAATPAEIEAHVSSMAEGASRHLETKNREQAEAQRAVDRIKDLQKTLARGKLTEPQILTGATAVEALTGEQDD